MIRTQMGKQSRPVNGCSCTGRFARYHPVTVASNQFCLGVDKPAVQSWFQFKPETRALHFA
jgi:hypothetical protein